MLNKIGRIKILWVMTAVFSLAASLLGIVNPGIYNGLVGEKYIPGTISQDYTVLLAAVILLMCTVLMKEEAVIKQIVGLGIIGFLFYAYGIFVIEQVYNSLYFLYMAIFALSFYSIVYSITQIRKEIIQNVTISSGIRKASVVFSLMIPTIFSPIWIMMLIPLLKNGDRIENIFSVFILDLCFIMPAFVILAVMTAKKRGLGLILTPSMFILGFTLLFPVGFAEMIKLIYSMNMALDLTSMLMYCGISILFLILAAIYLTNFKKQKETVAEKSISR